MSKNELKLKLRNFRRFAQTDVISFQPGLTIISGPNGAGKSTLVESIIFALYGQKNRKVPDIRSDNASGEICVECELLIDDQFVKVVRSSTTAALWINNVPQVQNTPSSLNAANHQIKALLGGLERDQFESTYVALQGDTAGLVEEKSQKKRREIIEKILQLDVLEQAVQLQAVCRDKVKETIKAQSEVICEELRFDEVNRTHLQRFQRALSPETRMQHIRKSMVAIQQVLQQRHLLVNEAKDAFEAKRVEVTSIEEKQKECKKTIEQRELDCKAQEALQKKHQDVETKIASVDGRLQQIETDIQKYQASINQAEQYLHVAEEYARLQKEIKRRDERLAILPLIRSRHKALTTAQDELKRLDSKLEPLAAVDEELIQAQKQEMQAKQRRDQLHNNDPTSIELTEWQQLNERLKLEEKQNREALDILQNSAGEARCPACNQRFTEHTPEHRIQHLTLWLSEQLPQRRSQLSEQKKKLDSRNSTWQQEKGNADKEWQQFFGNVSTARSKVAQRDNLHSQQKEAISSLHRALQEWDELGEESAYNPEEASSLQEERNALEKKASELKEEAEMYAHLPSLRRSLAEKQQDLTRLKLDVRHLKEQQAAIGYIPDKLQAVKDALSAAQTELTNILESLAVAKSDLSQTEREVKLAIEAEERATKYYCRFGEVVKEFQYEDRLHILLEEFKKHFFVANTEEVARRTTQLLLHAVTDQSILGIKFDSNELYYLDASHTPRSINRLSGGEKALVGLCLRIALAEQAQAITRTGKVRFLILDEVLSSLDDERCNAVQQIFEDVQRRGIFEHIVMITHLDTVKHNWQATGLEVQKVSSKTSKVIPVTPGEFSMDFTEEIEV